MDKKWKLSLVASALVVGASVGGWALASWGSDAGDNAKAGMANPASVFCEEQGGTVEIVTDAAGNQSGICHLTDGTQIEEWDFYRRFDGDDSSAGLANPAAAFCERRGGAVSGVEPMCELPDGSLVDAWDYFRAENPASH